MSKNNANATNKAKDTRTIADIIKHEGIKAKGFGIISKFATHDRDMTVESKAILGYICSLCGNGSSTFPSRATILRHLNLSKDGYYKHYKSLIEHGYIRVEKADPSALMSVNVYTIVELPPKVIEAAKAQERAVSSIYDFGYGILPKAVMMDERLSPQAKAIYCYLASYAEAGSTAFPEKKNILYHLNLTEPRYYRHYNQLIRYNYVTPTQRHHNGRLGVCDYVLNMMPDEATGAAIRKSRRVVKKQDTQKQDTSSINGSSTSLSINSPISVRESLSPAPLPIRVPENSLRGNLSINHISENFENSAKNPQTATPDSGHALKRCNIKINFYPKI